MKGKQIDRQFDTQFLFLQIVFFLAEELIDPYQVEFLIRLLLCQAVKKYI